MFVDCSIVCMCCVGLSVCVHVRVCMCICICEGIRLCMRVCDCGVCSVRMLCVFFVCVCSVRVCRNHKIPPPSYPNPYPNPTNQPTNPSQPSPAENSLFAGRLKKYQHFDSLGPSRGQLRYTAGAPALLQPSPFFVFNITKMFMCTNLAIPNLPGNSMNLNEHH